jgi:hypothetical protein
VIEHDSDNRDHAQTVDLWTVGVFFRTHTLKLT